MTNLVDVVTEIVKRSFPTDIKTGRVERVDGPQAWVSLSGARQTVPAYYNINEHPKQGDECILIKSDRTAPWVITTVYSRPSFGQSNYDRVAPAHHKGSTYFGNAVTIPVSANTSSTSTLTEVTRLTIRTRGGPVLIGLSGYVISSSSTARALHARIRMSNNNEINLVHQMPTTGTLSANINLFRVLDDVPPGEHSVILDAYSTVSNVGFVCTLQAAEL